MTITIPDDVRELVQAKYEAAVASGHVQFTETTQTAVRDEASGMQYVVSYAPSLQQKPERGSEELKEDPFAKAEPELTVLENVGPHRLVLNKFPVTPGHALLVTREYAAQTAPLQPEDLETAYALVRDMDDEAGGVRHMVFFNCGANSGSSVDHKHLQLLRLPAHFSPFQDRLCAGEAHFTPGPNREPLQDAHVPFAHFVIPLPRERAAVDGELLAMTYAALLQRVLTFFQNWTDAKPTLRPAYNILLTARWLCAVPRSRATCESARIGFNATGYAGLVLVKWPDVHEEILAAPERLAQLLLECGFPNTAGNKPDEYDY
ncbi:AFR730Wp [Eremothecium gossypii ATCC 10895]|uniref:AFR730Wp n=1 Tax=Eremothecium gossypii (strain ATCC 10895 / CBS 109.51 / FGSC 9923 / NRRL Y-1056) TaxID=284811 RepID=Q751U5_EREGS|nr:AFR730Wp [Eremothecium gossypii ATCC 10895]AAS54102.2 AFR730Wp [Eremothecium gossypii ATCC 10895]AEY98418.1 FAFR730Wp [Eremothecium gossypii FDAG1]